MIILTPSERRTLRARAHHLRPVVTVGQHGLTPAVLHEADIALLAHELVKIRVFSDVRDDREALFARICAELGAAPVQHVGKILTVWRPAIEPPQPAPVARTKPAAPRRVPRAGAGASVPGKRQTGSGGKVPQERKRAPATTKGPFEPGKRTPRTAGAAGPVGGKRHRGPMPAVAKGAPAATASRRRPRSGSDAAIAPPAPSTRRRRGQT